MLAGLETPDAGAVEMPRGHRAGYLPQFGFYTGDRTVWQEARSAFRRIEELERELHLLEEAFSAGDAPDDRAAGMAARHDQVAQELGRLEAHSVDRKVDWVLRGLGFRPEEFHRPVSELSGGWQMRVALARILLERPDVLLLDEPTNHLDLEAREWLEEFLRNYPASFVVVSHDRHFLDQTVTRITDIMSRRLVDYTGTYSQFVEAREIHYQQALKAYERQQDEIRRIQAFIDRFRAKNTKATQAQSRIRMLERMERLEPPESPPRTIRFRFPQPVRTGRLVLTLRSVQKSFGDLRVLRGADLQLERGQKVALVGPNGAGKSTLMRILAGVEQFEQGERVPGLRVETDHFAQDQADRLPAERTILQAAMARAPNDFVPQVRGLLGAFLFSGDAVDKQIGVLSGGERNRLALALMLMRPSNLLLMDEPTNHLDIAAKDVLLESLKAFEGTVVFVSHDRYFLSGLANRVIEVGGGSLRDHPGDYDSYLHRRRAEAEAVEAAAAAAARGAPGLKGAAGDRERGSGAGRERGSAPGGGRRAVSKRRLRELEERVSDLEARKARLEDLLAQDDIYRDPEKSSFYLTEYQEVNRSLDTALDEWAEAAESAEES